MNRRQLIASAATGGVAIAGGGAWYLLRDGDPKGASSQIDLLAGVYEGPPDQNDPEFLAMLSLTGGLPKNLHLELRLFDAEGFPFEAPQTPTATLLNLVTGEKNDTLTITQGDDSSWKLTDFGMKSDGWWQVVVSMGEMSASWTFLMPDPNLTGFDTPPVVASEPDAQAMLSASLNSLTQRKSLRWWEWLSGGNGAIILARFSVTTRAANNKPDSFESNSLMAGRVTLDGSPPNFRTKNPRAITVGNTAKLSISGGTPEVTTTSKYLPISEYDTTYDGHDGAHFGITAEIGGRQCQLVAFHLPSQIEAWFAFWIDIETLYLRELFMLSVNHYMHWVYSDYDEPFELGF